MKAVEMACERFRDPGGGGGLSQVRAAELWLSPSAPVVTRGPRAAAGARFAGDKEDARHERESTGWQERPGVR
jgi:hypothetical protein